MAQLGFAPGRSNPIAHPALMSLLRFLAFACLAGAVLGWMATVPDGSDPLARVRLTLAPMSPGGGLPDRPEYAARTALTILPDLSPEAAPVPPEPKLVQPRIAPPDFTVAGGGRAEAAMARLAASLTPDMRAHFGLFVFVSKAAHGPLAQRMYVFRNVHGGLALLHDWRVSTGREKNEISPRGRSGVTATPAGFYQLDPERLYSRYRSWNWDQDMPWAMFFNWERQGRKTGLAIHAAVGDDIARLGTRASAGCVHLAPDHAEALYHLIQDYRGSVPRFAYNIDTGTMSNQGGFMRWRDGSLKMTQGYRVLIDIDDYAGKDVIAALN